MNYLKRFLLSMLVVLLASNVFGITTFELDPTGISHICWPFSDSDWDNPNGWTPDHGNGHGEATHKGSDYYSEDWNKGSYNSDCGEYFHSPISGKVIYAGGNSQTGYGYHVVVQSDLDFNFAFRIAHLLEGTIDVAVGDYVNIGRKLGEIGSTGASTYCHAHITLYKNINDKYPKSDSPHTALWRLERGYSLGVHGEATKWAAHFVLDAKNPEQKPQIIYEDHFTRVSKPWWTFSSRKWYVSRGQLKYRDKRRTGKAMTPMTNMTECKNFVVTSMVRLYYSYRRRGMVYVYFPGGYVRLEDRRNRITIRTNRSHRFRYNISAYIDYNILIEGTDDAVKLTINNTVFTVNNDGIVNDDFGYKVRRAKALFDDFIVLGTLRSMQSPSNISENDITGNSNLKDQEVLSDFTDSDNSLTNAPNPFNSHTSIRFMAKSTGECKVKIFNIMGVLVKEFTKNVESGELYSLEWNINGNSSTSIVPGLYLSTLTIDGELAGQNKMIITK